MLYYMAFIFIIFLNSHLVVYGDGFYLGVTTGMMSQLQLAKYHEEIHALFRATLKGHDPSTQVHSPVFTLTSITHYST